MDAVSSDRLTHNAVPADPDLLQAGRVAGGLCTRCSPGVLFAAGRDAMSSIRKRDWAARLPRACLYDEAMPDAEMVNVSQNPYGEFDLPGRPNGPLELLGHAAPSVYPPQTKPATGGPG